MKRTIFQFVYNFCDQFTTNRIHKKIQKMPGKVLKCVDWIVDIPAREDIVGKGIVRSSKFTINYGGIATEWEVGVFFNRKSKQLHLSFLFLN